MLDQHCEFKAHVDIDQMVRFYNACDIYVQPSHQEGFCMAMLEAISCGRPVVGTRVGAIPEMIDGSGAGVLISPNQPEELSQAIIRLAEGGGARDPRAQHSYVVQNYSWSVVAEKTISLYRDACLRKTSMAMNHTR